MKKYMCLAALAAFAGLAAGCDKGTPGGPGATTPSSDKKNVQVGQAENSFKLSPPMLSTRLKQGETKVIAISINRGKNFDQDVNLRFENIPDGVSIDPSGPTIKHGADETKLTVKAAENAAVGDFTVKVIGHPKDGPDSVNDLKLTVSKK